MSLKELTRSAQTVLSQGGVFVPSPLALDENKNYSESYQRLLTLYYIKAGAKAVIPGAHTGEFALDDIDLLQGWMQLTKEMIDQYGDNMMLLTMIGGSHVLQQAELAAKNNYDAVMIAPTAFNGKSIEEILELFNTVSSIVPTFAFELQQAIPGSYHYTLQLWEQLFEVVQGAKGASFDTYRSLVMLEAAARSPRKEKLILFTGNDDRIVADLLGDYAFKVGEISSTVTYKAGLLGHFATDTRSAVQWFNAIKKSKHTGSWDFSLTPEALAHGVNRCNMALFDALGNFENSVYGVKYRLASLGLLPGPYCMHEDGRQGQAEAIDAVYNEYQPLNDRLFIEDSLPALKQEVGIDIA